eukprot:7082379-Prymnesium_polylepis.1
MRVGFAYLPSRLRPRPHGEHVADGSVRVCERSVYRRPAGVVRELVGRAVDWLSVAGARRREHPPPAEE